MDAFSRELNILLVDTFRSILKMEERMLKDGSGIDLSIHEMHVLEAVGQGSRPRTISDIARDLDITLPSATIAINKLARKGYVEKSRGASDKRQVLVTLTRQGRKCNTAHEFFHQQMVRAISAGFSEEERSVLLAGMQKLNAFFHRSPGLGHHAGGDGGTP